MKTLDPEVWKSWAEPDELSRKEQLLGAMCLLVSFETNVGERPRSQEERQAALREWAPANGNTSAKPLSTGQNPLERRATHR
jgi:hypothetical protein